jgi:hypothetical protein
LTSIGVVLQDAEEEYMGNLTVYPGSHYQLQNYFRLNGFEKLYLEGVRGLPQLDFNETRPVQIRARAGDAVILNYSTAHNIAPNISPFIRYTVYFRITTTSAETTRRVNHQSSMRSSSTSPMSAMAAISASTPMRHRPEAMLSVWSDWKGLQRMSLPGGWDDGGGVLAVERGGGMTASRDGGGQKKNPPTAPKANHTSTVTVAAAEEEEEEMRQLALALERSKYET